MVVVEVLVMVKLLVMPLRVEYAGNRTRGEPVNEMDGVDAILVMLSALTLLG
jgi:hypothetical protein